MMRYNVVIGGQEVSKTMRGYLDYQVPIFGIEGALAALGAIMFSLCLAYVFVKVFTISLKMRRPSMTLRYKAVKRRLRVGKCKHKWVFTC